MIALGHEKEGGTHMASSRQLFKPLLGDSPCRCQQYLVVSTARKRDWRPWGCIHVNTKLWRGREPNMFLRVE